MKAIKTAVILFVCMILIACQDRILGDDPANTPKTNFDLLWQDFDRLYPYFEHKNINWDSLYNEYHSQVSASSTPSDLFQIVSQLLSQLEDGHVTLTTPNGNFIYRKNLGAKDYFDPIFVRLNYLNWYSSTTNKKIAFGQIHYRQITAGYIHIVTFERDSESFETIEKTLQEFASFPGLVIDLRNNYGGNEHFAREIAQLFTDKRKMFRYLQFRNGPKHSDFTNLIPDYIDPGAEMNISIPIALLTNKYCFSATESFVLAMKTLPNVVVVGDSTGGSSGNPIYRELPNGWIYQVPRWIMRTTQKNIVEDVGIAPDIYVDFSDYDTSSRDKILDSALFHILNIANKDE